MRIGQFDRRITIQQPSESQSDFGDMTITWSTLRTVWAHVLYKSGKEKEEAGRMTDITEIIFTIRYASDITQHMRISFDSNTYYIDEVLHHGRRKLTQLKTKLKK